MIAQYYAFERKRFCDPLRSDFVRSFRIRTLLEPVFWKGVHCKISNEHASATPSEAISFEVLECEPFQNLYSGRVRVGKLRTDLQIRVTKVEVPPTTPRALVHPRRGGVVHRRVGHSQQRHTARVTFPHTSCGESLPCDARKSFMAPLDLIWGHYTSP